MTENRPFMANRKKSGSVAGLIIWTSVSIGLAFATFNGEEWSEFTVAGVLMVISILFIAHHIRQLSTARQHLVIDESGVLYRWWSERPVPWSDIRSARIHRRHSTTTGKEQRILILKVDATKNRHRDAFLRWLRTPFMAIPTKEMDTSTEQIVAAIRRFAPNVEFS